MDKDIVADYGNLYRAYKEAKSGKKFNSSTARFSNVALDGINILKEQLENQTYTVAPYNRFEIYEPKQRVIESCSFKDKVVQHVLCDNILHPKLKNVFIKYNSAGQIGKGTLYALDGLRDHMESFYQRHGIDGWILKCDIRHFFYEIDHEILKDIVDCLFPNPYTIWLNPPDRVYMSKVFTFTPDYLHPVCAGEIIKGGTGYEYPSGGKPLPEEIEHIYPDYSLYPELCNNTAYVFLTRGCPRGCDFCIVKEKEGQKSHKVSDLSEFWNGQKNIVLLDPNMFACREWKDLSQQLIDSKAWVDFSQGCDIRIMTEEKAEYIKRMKIKQIHFAWDRYQDKDIIVPKFQMFQKLTGWDRRKMTVYVLCGFDTTLEQDLDRIYTLRDLGYAPYVMIYDKYKLKKRDPLKRMQRWVNSRFAFMACEWFEDYTG